MRPAPGDGLVHPVALVAIVVLVVNDHWGKAAFPGLLTGKLSDFAGLLFFPLFLQAGVELGLSAARRPRTGSLRVLGACSALSALVFALVKLDTPMTALYRVGLGALQWPVQALAALIGGEALPGLRQVAIWTDPTDLVALPMVLVAVWLGRARTGSPGDKALPRAEAPAQPAE